MQAQSKKKKKSDLFYKDDMAGKNITMVFLSAREIAIAI